MTQPPADEASPLPPESAALTFGMDVADVLLSMGVPASDVVAAAVDVLEVYSPRAHHVDVLSSVVMVTHSASRTSEPVTAMRAIQGRMLDYTVVQGVQDLVHEIRTGSVPLPQAKAALLTLLQTPPKYGVLSRMVAAGFVSAGVPLLFGGTWLVTLLTFVVGCLADLTLGWAGRRGMPSFFVQALVAAVVTYLAALSSFGMAQRGLSVNATQVVAGGVVMLLVGLMFVGAFQDAIDEYYVTATARVFRVAMMTAGIVTGLLIGLWLADLSGMAVRLDPDPLALGNPYLATVGAALIAGMYAWYCQARPAAAVISAAVGVAVWFVFLAMYEAGSGEIPASGVGAVLSGLLGSLVARRWRIPGIAVMTAGIVTLVPGLRLFHGLLQVAYGDPTFQGGSGTLLGGFGIAFAIAAGASTGAIIGRPLRQRLILARNLARHHRTVFRRLGRGERRQVARR